ncbi:hypothetical protein BBJ28_00010786 [Nothophytophthora sp. Chile5]|nr:hypothetical protein BBJ28_00010786 [Nothophytophthora sp. Chile5]
MPSRAVSVFFGSQTGCAESIAQRIYDEALEKQLDAELLPLNDFQKSKVESREGHLVVIVCSTTGNGDPPDNCGKFWRYVKRRTQPKDLLAKLRYSVLGLGDTNYDKFCFMGKGIDKRMRELGAQSFYGFGTFLQRSWSWNSSMHCLLTIAHGSVLRAGAADEAMGLEDSVEPWLAGLWAAFDKATGTLDAGNVDDEVTSSSSHSNSPEVDGLARDSPVAPLPTVPTSSNASYLLANLISYEKMFGPLETPTEIPEDLPRLQSSLLNVRFLDVTEPQEPAIEAEEEISSTSPYLASIVGAEYLTAAQAERKVLRLDIALGDSGIQYIPGDSIGIKCPNRAEDVEAVLACLGLNGDQIFSAETVAAKNGRTTKKKSATSTHFPSPCSIRDVFLHHVDLRSSPKKAALRALAAYCSDEEQQARMLLLSSKVGADKYKAFITEQQLNFVELLHLFPSCNPSLDHLLTLLPQLMPRYYSITTSPLVDATRLSVAFTVVDNAVGTHGLRRRGLCTNWLNDICQPLLGADSPAAEAGVKIPIFVRGTQDFHLPESASAPMLLIGPGTGVAPFMGFLQHRQIEAELSTATQQGKTFLFFGCRRQSEDWLFREQMHEYLVNGTLTQLFTAFSRDQEEKHYVQHELKDNGKLVCELLLGAEGYVFVCGDGMAMAKDVHSALVSVLVEHAGLSEQAAEDQLRELGAQQRYVRDIW